MRSHHGNRCILFARGVHGEEGNSIERQISRLQEFASRQKLRVVGDVRVDAQPATRWNKEELKALVKRKQEQNDFDLVLTADLTRLGRDGVLHLLRVLAQFDEVGLGLVTLDNGVINPSLSGMIRFSGQDTKDSSPDAKNYQSGRTTRPPGDDARRAAAVPFSPDDVAEGACGAGTRTKKGD